MARLMPLTIAIEETICLAVQLRAEKDGASSSDVVNAILRQVLTAEIVEVSGLAPLAALVQNLHDRCQSRPANGSHRPVLSPEKVRK
jgi:hypothetical protein